ncbi:MAG: ArgR family transcriptional regulator [Spirochaetia bacterium]|nr:ArgR family transcriptional regulator [Spirochaetia bacterium]
MEKQARLTLIRHLIADNNIQNQEQLQALLLKHDVVVTQATLSRDLKFLKVGKVHRPSGYCYSVNEDELRRSSAEYFINDISRGFLSMDFSGNMGVIRTLPGYANTVAVAFDNLELEEILGTVAGDDTVIFVIKEGITKEKLREIFKEKFPSLDI